MPRQAAAYQDNSETKIPILLIEIEMMKKITLLSLLALSTSVCAQSTTIHCGKLFDATSGRILDNQYITVTNDTITAVESRSNSNVDINLADKTCLPGLIDLHVHLSDELSPRSYLHRYQWSESDFALNAANNAYKDMLAGFTTVRDLGDQYLETIALRNAISRGVADGPRIFAAGKNLASTGGHGDPTNGVPFVSSGDPGPREGVINSPEDARKAVRQAYKNGSNVIKITATGGVLSLATNGQNAQFTPAELDAIIETATDYGMHVAAHAHGIDGMLRAVNAGVKTIEHGTYMNDAIINAMKENDAWYIPTISAGQFVAEKAKIDGYFPEVVRGKAATIGPLILETFRKAHKAGVNIAFGTDTGVSAHGNNAQEFGFMVEGGMTPAEALQAATIKAADVLDQEQTLGQVAPGFFADIIAVDNNPLDDISTMNQVEFVMKGGKVYSP